MGNEGIAVMRFQTGLVDCPPSDALTARRLLLGVSLKQEHRITSGPRG